MSKKNPSFAAFCFCFGSPRIVKLRSCVLTYIFLLLETQPLYKCDELVHGGLFVLSQKFGRLVAAKI